MINNSMPIIIGGNGGSGTRVVAEILIRSGVYLGYDLNESNDNLLFTYLFKHPYRFNKRIDVINSKHKDLFILHEKLIFGKFPTRIRDILNVLRSGWDHACNYYDCKWVLERLINKIRFKKNVISLFWGWKEPHTIFFLSEIKAHYPNAKFILVMRNGLDMAYTKTDQQMKYWGSYYKIDSKNLGPKNKFEFWYRSNLKAINMASDIFDEKFLLLKLEELCLNRDTLMRKLFEFVGLNINEILPEVWSIPQLPESYGRYRKYDTNWIDSDVKRKLRELGYEYN